MSKPDAHGCYGEDCDCNRGGPCGGPLHTAIEPPDPPAMCYVGNVCWMHHDWHWPTATCKRCKVKMPSLKGLFGRKANDIQD